MPSIPPKTGQTERPPVIVVMGHIDHGKSRLLDYIRKTNIVDGEAGGITQHVGAYEVIHTYKTGKERRITFLDTPGHEAFAGIRSRGASVADIAILVVSAEEGVKPQTVEALKYIKEAGIPYIVAINKIDKPTADTEKTKQSLAEHEVYLEGYGGNIPFVPISAKEGTGVDELLDMTLLIADLAELKEDLEAPAEGVIIESNLDKRRGVAATVIIKNGTLRQGGFVMAGEAFAPLRMLEDFQGKKITEATPSSPVQIIGWDKMPSAGSQIKTCITKKEAEEKTDSEITKRKSAVLKANTKERDGAKNSKPAEAGDNPEETEAVPRQDMFLIIKADRTGSLEALEHELRKIKEGWINLEIVGSGVGEINESDVKTALGARGAVILGFNVKIDSQAKSFAERLNIKIETFDIIYKLIDFVRERIAEKKPKVVTEEETGRVKILKVFGTSKGGQIVGGKVESGEISVGNQVKILRREAEIGFGKIKNLEQQKAKVSTVKKDTEFGALVDTKTEIAPGDRLEAFTVTEK